MSYAGMYDPTPVSEPKKKPKMAVDLRCGESVMADPWWYSDPLYGGWNPPAFTWCSVHQKMCSVKQKSYPSNLDYS